MEKLGRDIEAQVTVNGDQVRAYGDFHATPIELQHQACLCRRRNAETEG